MNKNLKRTWVKALLYLGGALVLSYMGFLFQEQARLLDTKNQHYQKIINGLKATHFPEQFISLLDEDPQAPLEETLAQQAKTHYMKL